LPFCLKKNSNPGTKIRKLRTGLKRYAGRGKGIRGEKRGDQNRIALIPPYQDKPVDEPPTHFHVRQEEFREDFRSR
jgi:hypothetical protein